MMTSMIDRKWRAAFVLRLRMLDASGEQIGDALKVVEAHCAETGEAEAFGNPREYADSLGLGQRSGWSARRGATGADHARQIATVARR